MKITVTKKHLDLAIEARKREDYDTHTECVVAQAMKEIEGFCHMGKSFATFKDVSYYCDAAYEFVSTFTTHPLNGDYGETRARLPITLEFIKET